MRSGGHDRHRDRDSSRSRDRRDDRYDRDRRDRDDDRAGEKWVTDTPSNTVILQRLPTCIEEKDIKAELMMFGAPIRDVRLMRKSSEKVDPAESVHMFDELQHAQRSEG